MERESFLARVGRASMTAQLPNAQLSGSLPDYPSGDLVALFRARATAVSAVVHGPMGRAAVPRVVAAIATGHDATTFMAWDHLPVPGVPIALAAEGLDRVGHEVATDDEERALIRYADLDVGITGSVGGLAESGSVILTHGPGRPRLASLVPEIHIALVDAGSITTTLAHWARENPGAAATTTNLVVVTGPSRTADIEQQLNLGVHGPRHLHIVIIR